MFWWEHKLTYFMQKEKINYESIILSLYTIPWVIGDRQEVKSISL